MTDEISGPNLACTHVHDLPAPDVFKPTHANKIGRSRTGITIPELLLLQQQVTPASSLFDDPYVSRKGKAKVGDSCSFPEFHNFVTALMFMVLMFSFYLVFNFIHIFNFLYVSFFIQVILNNMFLELILGFIANICFL